MAFDELIGQQLALFQGLLMNSLQRWADAANRARSSSYTAEDFFQDLRGQFVENWDMWNVMMEQPVTDKLPIINIRGSQSYAPGGGPVIGLAGAFGEARVKQRLTYALLQPTPLYRFGAPPASILATNYGVSIVGPFEGMVRVDIRVSPATALVAPPLPDIYRGVILARFPGETYFGPLAFVVVVVEP